MNRGLAIPNKRIIPPLAREQDARPARRAAAPSPTVGDDAAGLSTRTATADDLPWLQAWAAQLGLPAPRSRRVRSFILLKDSQRVGYMGVREDLAETDGARAPIMWVVSAFLVPALRGQGLILKFGEILSRQIYTKGKVGCRVAADNARMMRLMTKGGWKKTYSTRRFTDFMLELDGPFRATRRG